MTDAEPVEAVFTAAAFAALLALPPHSTALLLASPPRACAAGARLRDDERAVQESASSVPLCIVAGEYVWTRAVPRLTSASVIRAPDVVEPAGSLRRAVLERVHAHCARTSTVLCGWARW